MFFEPLTKHTKRNDSLRLHSQHILKIFIGVGSQMPDTHAHSQHDVMKPMFNCQSNESLLVTHQTHHITWAYQSHESNGISLQANTLQFSPSHVHMAIFNHAFQLVWFFILEIKATFAKSEEETESERKGDHVNLMFYVVSVMRGCEI